jgi:hypothetical protein
MELHEMRKKKDTLSLVPVICFVAGLHMIIARFVSLCAGYRKWEERSKWKKLTSARLHRFKLSQAD